MKSKPDSDDMGVGIMRTVFGYGCLIAGTAILIILALAASCKL